MRWKYKHNESGFGVKLALIGNATSFPQAYAVRYPKSCYNFQSSQLLRAPLNQINIFHINDSCVILLKIITKYFIISRFEGTHFSQLSVGKYLL